MYLLIELSWPAGLSTLEVHYAAQVGEVGRKEGERKDDMEQEEW